MIRTATTLSLDPGATLVLAAASNASLVTVTAPGATITGAGTLDGNRGAQTQGGAISVGGASNVTVRNVRIRNARQSGIYAANAANLTISGVSVSGTGYIGIFAEATTGQLTNLVIENSRVDRSSEGTAILEGGIIVHRTGAAPAVTGVRISGNVVTMPRGTRDATVAIETYGGVQGAIVQNNATSGAFIGISIDHTTTASVTGNTVSGASGYGIELAASRQTTVSANTVQCSGYTPEGIVLDNAAPTDNTISSNTVNGCVSRGIALNRGSDRVSIAGNTVNQAAGYAIELLGSASVKVTNNVLDGNGSALKALVGESSPNLTVTGNRIVTVHAEGCAALPVEPGLDLGQLDRPERRLCHSRGERHRCHVDGEHLRRRQDCVERARHRHLVERDGDQEHLQKPHAARSPALRRFSDRPRRRSRSPATRSPRPPLPTARSSPGAPRSARSSSAATQASDATTSRHVPAAFTTTATIIFPAKGMGARMP